MVYDDVGASLSVNDRMRWKITISCIGGGCHVGPWKNGIPSVDH